MGLLSWLWDGKKEEGANVCVWVGWGGEGGRVGGKRTELRVYDESNAVAVLTKLGKMKRGSVYGGFMYLYAQLSRVVGQVFGYLLGLIFSLLLRFLAQW